MTAEFVIPIVFWIIIFSMIVFALVILYKDGKSIKATKKLIKEIDDMAAQYVFFDCGCKKFVGPDISESEKENFFCYSCDPLKNNTL